MERRIPSNTKHLIYQPLNIKKYLKNEEVTPEFLIDKIKEYEEKCEDSIIKTLGKVGINAMKKTDKFSLPYNREIKLTKRGESWVNGPYEFYWVARNIVKELLNENLLRVRFYMFVDISENVNDDPTEIHPIFNSRGRIDYYFRYYIK